MVYDFFKAYIYTEHLLLYLIFFSLWKMVTLAEH